MLCPCPKLSPLQSRLLASVLTLALLGVIYWTLSHPYVAYAAELEFDGAGRSRAGEDHNWHRIAQQALDEDEDGFEEVTGTAVLTARAPQVSTTAGNNVPNLDNIEPGNTTVWEFTAEQLRSPPTPRGPGLPKNVRNIAKASLQHVELRKRALERYEGEDDEDDEEQEATDLEARQTDSPRTIYVSINTCLQPDYVGTDAVPPAPPQLTLYIATEKGNRRPGPDGQASSQREITLDEGFAATSIEVDDNWYMSVHAPALPNGYTGVWNYELAVSIDGYYHAVDTVDSNLFLLDTDSTAALMVTDNLTQAEPSSPSYQQWMDLTAPYIVFANNVNHTRIAGISNSFCGLNMNSQIVGSQSDAAGNSTGVQMQMTTRGLGNKPKEQFYVTSLNSSSTYYATLARVGNSTASGQGVVNGGGKVWRTIDFTTKTDGNCALLFNLEFCSEVAYAVPSTPDIVSNYTNFQHIYDNYTLFYYRHFNYSLQQVACSTDPEAQYSLARNCDDCAKAYKDWLCAVSIPRCTDFSAESQYYLPRNMGQPFLNGSMLPSSILNKPYVPMDGAPTLEGTVAYEQTHISSMATNSSRNPIIDQTIAPGPYKEVLPCEDLCWGIVQSCPAALGFGCPYPGRGLEAGYGTRKGNGNGSLSCSFLGAYVYTGGSGVLQPGTWMVFAVVSAVLLVGL